jgi:hypothetical protein
VATDIAVGGGEEDLLAGSGGLRKALSEYFEAFHGFGAGDREGVGQLHANGADAAAEDGDEEEPGCQDATCAPGAPASQGVEKGGHGGPFGSIRAMPVAISIRECTRYIYVSKVAAL